MAFTNSASLAKHGAGIALRATSQVVLVAAIMVSAAAGAVAATPEAIPSGPRLASLQIQIWPEFDRPAAALVILHGELAPDVALPATVSLRIPATSGGPTAVAYSAAPGAGVLNLKYDQSNAGDAIALSFKARQRFFHVEFYDPLSLTGARRSYSYIWSAGLGADRLGVTVQEPAAASDLSVQPALGTDALVEDGLRYRSAELGPSPTGKQVLIKLGYTKSDPRTSADILGAAIPEAPLAAPAGPSKKDLLLWLTGTVVLLVLSGIAVATWLNRKRGPAEAKRVADQSCPKCRAPHAPRDRFCSLCGAPLG